MEPVTIVSIVLVIITIIIGVLLAVRKKFRITWLLSGSFIAIFLVQAVMEPDLLRQNIGGSWMLMGGGEFIPFHFELGFSLYYFLELPKERWYTVLTASFTHSNILHLFMNSIFLLLIGLPLEKKIGRVKFLMLFLLSGIIGDLIGGSLGYVEFYSISKYSVGIGASGAIFGIMGCYFFLYPNDRIWFFLNAPVWLFVLVYFLFNALMFMLLRGSLTTERAYISYEGHIAGLIAGIILGVVYKYMAKIPTPTKEPKELNIKVLKLHAKTKRLKEILAKIEKEDEDDIRHVWLEEFAKNLKCKKCGNRAFTFDGSKLICDCQETIRIK
jgi:membrane associated rhomboid family serine protease